MMRSILLHVDEDDYMEARLQAALDLARLFDAHLTCLQVAPFELSAPGDFYGSMAAQFKQEFLERAPRVRKALEQRLQAEDVRWSWVQSKKTATVVIPRHAPLHDLLVLGGHDQIGQRDRPSELAMELLFSVRAPILMVPAACKSLLLDGPAVVAWNGLAEAAHAMRAALPLLARSSQVHILTVMEDRKPGRFNMPATDAAQYLARYAIEAEIVELPHVPGHNVAEELRVGALARNATFMVTGAYGHSRFRERLLGGVTYEMLTDLQIPTVLSH